MNSERQEISAVVEVETQTRGLLEKVTESTVSREESPKIAVKAQVVSEVRCCGCWHQLASTVVDGYVQDGKLFLPPVAELGNWERVTVVCKR